MMLEMWATIQVVKEFIGLGALALCAIAIAYLMLWDWWNCRKKG